MSRIVVLGIVISAAGWAADLRICVEEGVRLDRHTRAAFDREFDKLLQPHGVFLSCDSERPVSLSIRATPPERYRNALGLTWVRSTHVLPNLEIYVNPVVQRLEHSRAPVIVGRALARVAAHEVLHYLKQRHDHDENGLLRTSFSGWALAGADSHTFSASLR